MKKIVLRIISGMQGNCETRIIDYELCDSKLYLRNEKVSPLKAIDYAGDQILANEIDIFTKRRSSDKTVCVVISDSDVGDYCTKQSLKAILDHSSQYNYLFIKNWRGT